MITIYMRTNTLAPLKEPLIRLNDIGHVDTVRVYSMLMNNVVYL